MKIAIIGGGSLGLLFAYYLSKGHDVHLYTRTKEQSDIINRHGIHMIKSGAEHTASNITASSITDWQGTAHLTIIAVKQYQLAGLMPKLKANSSGSLLFIQNGYGHIKLLPELPTIPIYLGSVEHGAVKSGDNTVFHNGEGTTRAAVYKGSGSLLENLSVSLSDDFPVILEPDYKTMLIKKLVVNAVINPLTAVLQVKNGALISNTYFHGIFIRLFEECANVLELKNREDYFRHVVDVCKKTADNYSSMYKDIEEGRQTEIDSILGYMLEEARNKKMTAPLISNYYFCVKGKEHEREET